MILFPYVDLCFHWSCPALSYLAFSEVLTIYVTFVNNGHSGDVVCAYICTSKDTTVYRCLEWTTECFACTISKTVHVDFFILMPFVSQVFLFFSVMKFDSCLFHPVVLLFFHLPSDCPLVVLLWPNSRETTSLQWPHFHCALVVPFPVLCIRRTWVFSELLVWCIFLDSNINCGDRFISWLDFVLYQCSVKFGIILFDIYLKLYTGSAIKTLRYIYIMHI